MFLNKFINKIKQVIKKDKTNEEVISEPVKENSTDTNLETETPIDISSETETPIDINSETENLAGMEFEPENSVEFNSELDINQIIAEDDNIEQYNNSEESNYENIDIENDLSSIGEDDLDAAINDLLAKDAETELYDIDYDMVQDVAVYDNIEERKVDIKAALREEVEERNEKEEKSYIIFYSAIAALLIFTIIVAVIFLICMINLNKPAKKEVKKVVALEQPAYKYNNANYIFVGQEAIFENKKIELSKILVDSVASLFYFDQYIDTQKYNIMLVDDKDSVYNMDLSFVQNYSSEENSNKTVVRFEPLRKTIRFVTLTIFNPETGEKVDFKLDFSSNLSDTPVKYVYENNIKKPDDIDFLNIERAVFSSAGSRIDYTLKPNNEKYTIVHGNSLNRQNNITLEEGSIAISKAKSYPSIYSFENTNFLLGRMDFQSVNNINSKVYVSFQELYKKFDVNKTVSVASLGYTSEEQPYEIDVENYKVTLERIGTFNDKFVLVLHCIDKNIKQENENDNLNRVQVQLDAQIVGTTSNGMEIILDGSCRSGEIGTDMIFPLNETASDFIFGIDNKDINVKINSVLIKHDDVIIPIDLSTAAQREDNFSQMAESDIIRAFENRLNYKSGNLLLENIVGFKDNILNNEELMSDYKPQETTEKSQYCAQVVSSCFDNNVYYAVVQEFWRGINGIKEIHFYRTHKITAVQEETGWIINQDNIIK